MSKRTDLHDILIAILGSNNVYFQPPPSVMMTYPCIIYQRSDIAIKHANDFIYKNKVGYTVMVIDRNADSLIPDKMLTLPMCKFDRHYTAENLNHDVYKLYY
jgi:hypothetical protein